jgi:hypothetical protein
VLNFEIHFTTLTSLRRRQYYAANRKDAYMQNATGINTVTSFGGYPGADGSRAVGGSSVPGQLF